MEANETDKLLKLFFDEQKQVISDNGFTQRVIKKLPDGKDHTWIVWIFAGIGMTLSILLGIQVGWLESILIYLQHIQLFYLLVVIFNFPFVCSIAIYLAQQNHYRVI